MLRRVYSALLYVFAPLALTVTAARGLRDPAYRDRLAERLGYTRLHFGIAPLWIHAVSVGEVQAAAVLVHALRRRYPRRPLLVTTATPTGAQRVRGLFGTSASHAFLPYDLPGAVDRFLQRTRPVVSIVMEREIWPNLFRACRQRGIPVVLASARVSEPSARRHRRLGGLFRDAIDRNVTIAAQTEADAQRFRSFGARAESVHVTGNVKFDLRMPDEVRSSAETLRSGNFPGRPVWIAGSTHDREEDIVLAAHEQVRRTHPDALLLLVPRHPNRFDAVRAALKAREVEFVSRSALVPVTAATSVMLVDTLGELPTFYAASDVAFVGGSLVPIGGHNLLEPAALGRAIVVGPHNFNAPDIAALFLSNGAALQVDDADSLARAILDLLADPARRADMGAKARTLVESNRGAVARVVDLVATLLPVDK
jgi:3-deoxy-D-manno-octulosonic-acid transferase